MIGNSGRIRLLLGLFTGLALLSACSDDSDDGGDVVPQEQDLCAVAEDEATGHEAEGHAGGHEGSHCSCGFQSACSDDALTLAEGLTADSNMDMFSVEIVGHTDWSLLDNEWEVQLSDADGDPLTDAELVFFTWSNDCMHCGPRLVTEADADAEGVYTIEPAFSHGGAEDVGGTWDVRLQVTAGGVTDMIEMEFCVPGVDPPPCEEGDGGHEDHEGDGGTDHEGHQQ